MSTIKKDHCGLFVNAGGYICRPFFGTCFKEGDKVRAHHFGGSTRVGVGLSDACFRRKDTYELWSTTGCGYKRENKKEWKDPYTGKRCRTWEEYVKHVTDWYWFHTNAAAFFTVPHNKEYARRKHSPYKDYRTIQYEAIRQIEQ